MGVRLLVVSKSVVYDPTGTRYIKIELVEEREIPGPIFTIDPSNELARIVREVAPVIQQLMRALPISNKITVPRVTLFLTEDEAELLGPVDVGDFVEMEISPGGVRLIKVGKD